MNIHMHTQSLGFQTQLAEIVQILKD
jgi:hypothetical protein